MTDLKRAREEIKRAKEAAEEMNRLKSEFLATMSHEIRTPMNSIMGAVYLALECDMTPELRDYICTIQASAQSLLAIVDDILDFSKIEANRL